MNVPACFELFKKRGSFMEMGFHSATSLGVFDKVKEIAASPWGKENVNTSTHDGWTPLMLACAYFKNPQTLHLLIKEGASLTMRNASGYTALMLACMYRQEEAAIILIGSGADIEIADNEGWTALFYAVCFRLEKVVDALLQRNCKVNIKDIHNRTPLLLAYEAKNDYIIEELIHYGPLSVNIEREKIALNQIENNYALAPPEDKNPLFNDQSLQEVLENLGLSKYYPTFEKSGITVSEFWTLTDEDLIKIGIVLLGPRKKITSAIARRLEQAAKPQNYKCS